MHKAAQLSARLERLDGEEGLRLIEAQTEEALWSAVIDEVMCIMHSDGSVNLIAHMGEGSMTVEVISAGNILKVLKHYRPFKDVFKDQLQ